MGQDVAEDREDMTRFLSQSTLDGDFFWVVERAEDETFSIKKYRVMI